MMAGFALLVVSLSKHCVVKKITSLISEVSNHLLNSCKAYLQEKHMY